MCIKLHGLERCRLVMDPFLGIGNTAVACLNLNKAFIGFELDQSYYDEAASRVSLALSAGRQGPPSLFDGVES
jgi:site-specific DNA-methyltransferase (adenine-specific)